MLAGVEPLVKVETEEPLAWQVAQLLLENNHSATLQDTDETLRYEEGVYVPGAEAFIKAKIQGNKPPLHARELRRTFESALKYVLKSFVAIKENADWGQI